MIDFRYHLVSIVAVFLALGIGIVFGSTDLQGSTIDVLRSTSDSLTNKLNDVTARWNSAAQQAGASDAFLQTAEKKLLSGMLPGTRIVMVTEPGAPSGVVAGIEAAAGDAGATITGTIALQPKFNDLSGATRASLSALNASLASTDGVPLAPATDTQTAYQQEAAQLIAAAILEEKASLPELGTLDAQALLTAYEDGGYLSVSGAPAGGAALAVIVTPQGTAADGPSDPADEILLAVAAQFASVSAATLVAGPVTGPSVSSSAIAVLRGSSVSGQVSSVDNADTQVGQIVSIWALADQLAGGKPNSYGISGASAVSPVPLPVPSVTPSVSATPTSKATGKVKKTVNTK